MHPIEWHDKTSWNQFIATHSASASFSQSWEWGEFQKSLGYDIIRWGIYQDEQQLHNHAQPVACVTIIKRPLPVPSLYYWYIPRGPIVIQGQKETHQEVIKWLLRYSTKHDNQAVMLRIEPEWENHREDMNLENLGFDAPTILTHQKNPEATLITELNHPDAELLKNMHQKTRYNIRLAQKKNVELNIDSDRAHEHLWELLNATAKREHIRLQSENYYRRLYIAAPRITSNTLSDDHANLHSIIWVASFENTPVASGLWLAFGNTLTYLYGGSTRKHKNVMAPYALHWNAMQWGRENGYTNYDWWGVDTPGSVFNLKNVSRFKQGFGGRIVNYSKVGDIIYRNNTLKYLKVLKKLKNIF